MDYVPSRLLAMASGPHRLTIRLVTQSHLGLQIRATPLRSPAKSGPGLCHRDPVTFAVACLTLLAESEHTPRQTLSAAAHSRRASRHHESLPRETDRPVWPVTPG